MSEKSFAVGSVAAAVVWGAFFYPPPPQPARSTVKPIPAAAAAAARAPLQETRLAQAVPPLAGARTP